MQSIETRASWHVAWAVLALLWVIHGTPLALRARVSLVHQPLHRLPPPARLHHIHQQQHQRQRQRQRGQPGFIDRRELHRTHHRQKSWPDRTIAATTVTPFRAA